MQAPCSNIIIFIICSKCYIKITRHNEEARGQFSTNLFWGMPLWVEKTGTLGYLKPGLSTPPWNWGYVHDLGSTNLMLIHKPKEELNYLLGETRDQNFLFWWCPSKETCSSSANSFSIRAWLSHLPATLLWQGSQSPKGQFLGSANHERQSLPWLCSVLWFWKFSWKLSWEYFSSSLLKIFWSLPDNTLNSG